MSDKSKIEWTDATWNPIRGCSRVSEGCRHCYAEGVAARFSGPGQPYEELAKRVTRPDGSSEARWTGKMARAPEATLTQPLRWKKPRRIFVNSMSDLFHESVPDEWIDRIFAVMALSPQHTFQVLTKRPERMRAYVSDPAVMRRIYELACEMTVEMGLDVILIAHPSLESIAPPGPRVFLDVWPLPNVWLGTSCEDQVTADTRIPYLLGTPAAVRFISAEPLLGPMDITPFLFLYTHADDAALADETNDAPLPFHNPATTNPADIATPRLDWVIVGGESGHGARPMHPDWTRNLRDQCAAAGVAFFFKQWGEWAPPSKVPAAWRFEQATVLPDGRVREWQSDYPESRLTHPEMRPMSRVGKKSAGRQFDGVEHSAMPGGAA